MEPLVKTDFEDLVNELRTGYKHLRRAVRRLTDLGIISPGSLEEASYLTFLTMLDEGYDRLLKTYFFHEAQAGIGEDPVDEAGSSGGV